MPNTVQRKICAAKKHQAVLQKYSLGEMQQYRFALPPILSILVQGADVEDFGGSILLQKPGATGGARLLP